MKKLFANPKLTTYLFIAILAAYAVYAAIFIWETTFVFEGTRYFTLFDDAMVSMQFARNLAHGAGLVWNAGGERIEGYTNLLWVVFMSLFHLLPIAVSKISLAIQVSGAVFFMGSLYFVKKITERISGSAWAALMAVVVCAFYYPFSTWSLLGMEVSVLLLIVTAACYLALLRTTGEKAAFSAWVYVILGIGTLVRTDAVVPYLVIWAYLLWFDRSAWRRHLLVGSGILALCLGGQTIFRLVYYGDWLPNTYYLKMDGLPALLRIERGAYVFAKFAWNLGPILICLPLLVVLFRRDRVVLLLALLAAAQVAYSIYVGGDSWEHRGGANRFISLGMPFFFILFTETSRYIFKVLEQQGIKEISGRLNRWVKPAVNLALLLFVFLSLVNFNTLLDGNSLRQWVLIDRNIFAPGSERYGIDGLLLAEVTTPQATLAVAAAGNQIYFSDRAGIDLQGKVDKVIAREPTHPPIKGEGLLWLQPGHLKWDYARSVGEMKPDVIVDLILNTEDESAPYLVAYTPVKVNGHTMYFRTGSTNVLWDKIVNGQYKP